MNNINNDINKFDGKYLKCIISKYSAVTDYLANSGSVIILQPQTEHNVIYINSKGEEEKYNRNYMFLGNEFIASGYGFLCKDLRIKAENIVKTYDETINALKKADVTEIQKRTEEDARIVKIFDEYVKKDKGPIENTTVTINNVTIPTKDIILYGEEAHYDNLEVVSYSASINNISIYYDEHTLLCPIGTTVNNISIRLTTKDNDSGGVDYIKVLHNIDLDTSYSSNIETNENIEAIIIKYNYDYDYNYVDDLKNFSKYNLHEWHYSNNLSEGILINEFKKDMIKGLYLYVKATPQSAYKFYPRLIEQNSDWKIESSGNAIKANKIEINNSLSIKPQYYMKWVIDESPVLKLEDNTNTAPLNSFNDYDLTEIVFEIPDIPDVNNINATNSQRHIYIEIPSNFTIEKIYLIENNINKYNWTGAISKNKTSISLPCPYSSNINNNVYCIEYDIYHIESAGFKPGLKLCINIRYKYKKQNDDLDYSNNNVIIYNYDYILQNSIFNSNERVFINDEDFNNLYWINGENISSLNIQELKDKLEYVNENGVIKNII